MATKKKTTTKKAVAAKKVVKKGPVTTKKTVKKPAVKKPTVKKAAVKKAAAKKPAAKRQPNAAFMTAVQPDAALSAVVGSKPLPRTELTKKLWEYIKKHDLQDKKNRRNINADDKLKLVFNGKKTVSMFEMTKLVSGHVNVK